MLRNSRFLQVITVPWLILICGIQLSHANTILLGGPFQGFPVGGVDIGFVFASFCATLVVEYIVIYLLLGSPRKGKWQLFAWVLVVTLITNPAAQIAFLYLSVLAIIAGFNVLQAIILLLLVIELLVVTVEYFLLKFAFRSLHNSGRLGEPVSAGGTLKIAVLANIASAVVGFASFLVWGFFVYGYG